jgi:drug/metabolite transporter (DMT)-like permease
MDPQTEVHILHGADRSSRLEQHHDAAVRLREKDDDGGERHPLQYSAPIYTAVPGAFILRERPRLEHWLALAAVAVGMALFFMGDLGGGSLRGKLAIVASDVTFAAFLVSMRMQKDGSPLESNLLAQILTGAISLTVMLFLPAPALTATLPGAIAALGILQIGMASILLSWSIKRVTTIHNSIVAGLEPVFSPLWVFLVLGEKPGPNAFAGCTVIIVAVVISSLITAHRTRPGQILQPAHRQEPRFMAAGNAQPLPA